MKVLRKDFVPMGTVSYCNNRVLTSCKAYILEVNDEDHFYAGTLCIQKYFPDINLENIPDLTKALIYNTNNLIDKNNTSSSTKTNKNKNADLCNAISYLLLREVCLSNYELTNSFKFNKLTMLYETYKINETLSDSQIKKVLFYEKKSREINIKLSLKNLSTIYAYEFILKRAFLHIKNKNYVESLLQYLRKNGRLTYRQIEGLGKWLNEIPEMKNSKLMKFDI